MSLVYSLIPLNVIWATTHSRLIFARVWAVDRDTAEEGNSLALSTSLRQPERQARGDETPTSERNEKEMKLPDYVDSNMTSHITRE